MQEEETKGMDNEYYMNNNNTPKVKANPGDPVLDYGGQKRLSSKSHPKGSEVSSLNINKTKENVPRTPQELTPNMNSLNVSQSNR